ncbi:MAG: thioredoxin domain-containing protein [Microbacteriaceae bacterium]|nr:thioredoxin domain-containing protein [Microbacteriaceae bacterium]
MAKKDSQRIIEIREKANEQRREQQRRERRRTTFIQLGIAVGVLVIVGAVVAFVVFGNSAKDLSAPPSAQSTISLQGVDGVPLSVGGTAVTVGKADAPVTIDLYEDYSCPHCADYEAAVGPTLFALAASGDAVINFHPIRIVTAYGTAAGSAATCVAEGDSQNWPEFHSTLFANHSQQTDRWSASDFSNFAKIKGITDEGTLSCISKSMHADWIGSNTDASRDAGVTGTPTLMINGEIQATLLGPDEIIAAVDSLKGN